MAGTPGTSMSLASIRCGSRYGCSSGMASRRGTYMRRRAKVRGRMPDLPLGASRLVECPWLIGLLPYMELSHHHRSMHHRHMIGLRRCQMLSSLRYSKRSWFGHHQMSLKMRRKTSYHHLSTVSIMSQLYAKIATDLHLDHRHRRPFA